MTLSPQTGAPIHPCVDCQAALHALVIPCDDVDGDCPLCALGA